MKFKILRGSHFENNVMYDVKNPIIESINALDVIFPGRFAKITADAVVGTPESEIKATPQAEAKKPEVIKETRIDKPTIPDKGTLVDGSFDFDPDETGFHVFMVGKGYFVYDSENMEKPMNSTPLKKERVLKYLKSKLEG